MSIYAVSLEIHRSGVFFLRVLKHLHVFLCTLLIPLTGKIKKRRLWPEFKIHSSDIFILHTEQLHNVPVTKDMMKHTEYNVNMLVLLAYYDATV